MTDLSFVLVREKNMAKGGSQDEMVRLLPNNDNNNNDNNTSMNIPLTTTALDPGAPSLNRSEDDPNAYSSSPRHNSTGPLPLLEWPFQVSIHGQHPVKEATAQSMDALAKGVMHASAAFFGPALIQLATVTATKQYCQEHGYSDSDAQDFGECQPDASQLRVFGLKPSSFLTVGNMAATLLTALLLPLVGAMIDRSPHRKTVGIVTAALLLIINIAQTQLSESTWPLFWFTHAATDCLYMMHHMIVLAYLQELSTAPSVLSIYTSKFALLQFVAMAVYMASLIVYARQAAGGSIVDTSYWAHVVSASVSCVPLAYAWLVLFGPRPARLATHKENDAKSTTSWSTLVQESLSELRQTAQRIRQHYPALKWLLWTLLWSPNMGSGSGLSIFSTLQKSLLQMNAAQIGLSNLIVLTAFIGGAKLASHVTVWTNPLTSFRLALGTLFCSTLVTATCVSGPSQMTLYYGLIGVTGLSMGWLAPTERVLFCTLAPVGRETQLMGLLLAVHSAVQWMPPLVFSAVNEAGGSLQVAMGSQLLFHALALACCLGMGSFEAGLLQAQRRV